MLHFPPIWQSRLSPHLGVGFKRIMYLADKFTRKKLEILKCTAIQFRRHGYHGSSLTAIARASGMTKSNFYYYFKNKRQVLYFCQEYVMDCLLELLRNMEENYSSPVDELHALLVSFVRLMVDELPVHAGTMLAGNSSALSTSQYNKICAKRDEFEKGIRRIVKRGMDIGVFRSGDPKLITFAILGAVNWTPTWVDPSGPADSKEISRSFADFLVAGLLTPQSRRRNAPPFTGAVARTTLSKRANGKFTTHAKGPAARDQASSSPPLRKAERRSHPAV
jgi:AcrR family transcriptional regulator